MPKENYVILWPVYFDSRRSRKEGRMVRKDIAVENPTIDEIMHAAESLGYVKKIEEGAFPKYWWDRTGKVVVERKAVKSAILKHIAKKIKATRQSNNAPAHG